MRQRFRLINYIVMLIVILLVIAALVVVFGTKDKTIEAFGQVKPVRYEIIRAGLDGVIEKIYVQAGQVVRPGDTLFKLANPELNLSLEQTAKSYELAKFDLAQIKEEYHNLVKSESFETQSAFANLYQAKRASDIARKKYERAESLYVKGFTSSEDRDDRLLDYELAQSYYLSLKDYADLLERRFLLQIQEQEGKVELARQEYEHAAARLNEVIAVAPIAGEVLTSNLDELIGKRVNVGEAVMEIGDCTEMYFIARVSETDITLMRPNLEAKIFINAFPHRKYRTFEGTVVRISPLPNQTDQGVAFQTEILLADPWVDLGASTIPLKPGLLGKAEIIIEHDVRLLKLILDKK